MYIITTYDIVDVRLLQLDQEVGQKFGWDEAFGFHTVSRG